MFAASSAALSRVTSTPRRASSMDPMAMLTVNITGRATGTALISSTSESGRMSTSSKPSTSEAMIATATRMPTMRNSHLTTRVMTSSTCSFGCALSTSCVVRPK